MHGVRERGMSARDHVGLGVRPRFTMFSQNVFHIAVLEPTTPLRPLSSLILKRTVHVFSLSDSMDLNQGTEGYLATHLASHC